MVKSQLNFGLRLFAILVLALQYQCNQCIKLLSDARKCIRIKTGTQPKLRILPSLFLFLVLFVSIVYFRFFFLWYILYLLIALPCACIVLLMSIVCFLLLVIIFGTFWTLFVHCFSDSSSKLINTHGNNFRIKRN